MAREAPSVRIGFFDAHDIQGVEKFLSVRSTLNNVLVILRTTFCFRIGAYDFFPFEHLSGFDSLIAQTKGPIEKKSPP